MLYGYKSQTPHRCLPLYVKHRVGYNIPLQDFKMLQKYRNCKTFKLVNRNLFTFIFFFFSISGYINKAKYLTSHEHLPISKKRESVVSQLKEHYVYG